MDCKKVLSMLSSYIDGEVANDEAEAITEHLSSCTSCAREMELMSRTAEMLSDVSEIEPPAFLLAGIEAATVNKEKPLEKIKKSLRPVWRAPLAVRWAVAVVAVFGVLSGGFVSICGVHRSGGNELAGLHVNLPISRQVQVAKAVTAPPAAVSKSVRKISEEVPSHVVASSRVVRTVRHRRHHRIVPAGHAYYEQVSPQLKSDSIAKNDGAPSSNVSSEPTPADDEIMNQTPSEEMRVASASESIRSEKEATAMEQIKASIANDNRNRKYKTYKDAVNGEKYSVDIASVRF